MNIWFGDMEPQLKLNNVSWRHKVRDYSSWKPWAKKEGAGIHQIDLEIMSGKILGLVGPNGAGKTTLIRAICGLYNCEGFNKSVEYRRKFIGYMPEQVRWEGRSTVYDALNSIAEMRQTFVDLEKLIKTVGLSSRSNDILDNLSQGMRQRLSLACALMGNPEIIVMDEPLNGLDPLAQRAFSNLMKQLSEKGISIIISSHQVADLEKLVDRIALLHHGQILVEGTLYELRKRMDLDEDSDIVEMICSVTGVHPDEITLDVSSDSLLPLRKIGGEEE
jgi:ABC-2 type transport system ATP-binding protein